MELDDAKKWADYQSSMFLTYYVIKWNDEYCVINDNHLKRHPDTKWVYKSKGH